MLLSYEALALDSHGIGAVRFGTGVRIRSLRVFPTGSRPFIHADVVAYVIALRCAGICLIAIQSY
jgi:hypothetical protein